MEIQKQQQRQQNTKWYRQIIQNKNSNAGNSTLKKNCRAIVAKTAWHLLDYYRWIKRNRKYRKQRPVFSLGGTEFIGGNTVKRSSHTSLLWRDGSFVPYHVSRWRKVPQIKAGCSLCRDSKDSSSVQGHLGSTVFQQETVNIDIKRYMDQWNRWPRVKPPQLKAPDFVFTKVAKNTHWWKISAFSLCLENWRLTGWKMKLGPHLPPYIKISCKWIDLRSSHTCLQTFC